jgi:hypothetical protein
MTPCHSISPHPPQVGLVAQSKKWTLGGRFVSHGEKSIHDVKCILFHIFFFISTPISFMLTQMFKLMDHPQMKYFSFFHTE